MAILERFTDIIKANINELLDKCEDPAKMIDQYLRNMTEDLAEVKKETAAVMAEETRAKRMLDDNAAEMKRYEDLARKALTAGNEGDARVFLGKKQQLAELKELVADIDPNAFLIVCDAHEVLGEGFGDYQKEEV